MRVYLLPLLLLTASATTASATVPAPLDESAATARPASQVVIEGAWAIPQGDLADDFRGTELGFGARSGFEVGFRWRLHLGRHFSLSPAFHFTDYGDHEDYFPDGESFNIACTTLLYTVELRYALRRPEDTARPFLAVAGGLYHNRVRGYDKTFEVALDEAVETFGGNARVGVRLGQLEFSAVYHLNRFSTWRFFRTGVDQPYSWDSIGVRMGWIIPFQSD